MICFIGIFRYSKHSFIYEQISPHKLADGTPTQKVYLASKLNRFPRNGSHYFNRRRIAAPSKVILKLYMFYVYFFIYALFLMITITFYHHVIIPLTNDDLFIVDV